MKFRNPSRFAEFYQYTNAPIYHAPIYRVPRFTGPEFSPLKNKLYV